ncbi:hypothetical protein [Aeromicrobium endophyticum]|uniref:hypothetical protein n=1 Tax=Aeromicrobium endophyticum TaxID=2292704 RepID=UPI0011C3C1FF
MGWDVTATLRADILPLQALNMAAWTADGDLDQLGPSRRSRLELSGDGLSRPDRRARRHTLDQDRGRQLRQRLAEAVNGRYKTELIRQRGP